MFSKRAITVIGLKPSLGLMTICRFELVELMGYEAAGEEMVGS